MARDPVGFDRHFDELAALAYRVAYRMLGDRSDAEDVAQETLARAYSRWRRVRGYPEPWVARVAANLALGLIRKRGRVQLSADHPGGSAGARGEPLSAPADLDAAELDELRAVLVSGLQSLSKRQREVVVLRYVADLSVADVASALGCSGGTVKTHAKRGLDTLRDRLGSSLDLALEAT